MLTMDDVPALPVDVRMRVIAAALDPDTPPVPESLIPADTMEADRAPQQDALVAVVDEPSPHDHADSFTHEVPDLVDSDPDEDPTDDDHW